MAFSEGTLQALRGVRLEAQGMLERDPANGKIRSIVALIDQLHSKMSHLENGHSRPLTNGRIDSMQGYHEEEKKYSGDLGEQNE